MRRLTFGIATTAVLAAAGLFGGVLHASPASPADAQPAPAGRLSGGFAVGDTRSLVASLEVRARRVPDGRTLDLLGLAYQQRARETGDPSFYGRSETALHDALRIDRIDVTAVGGLASLALSRHRFGEALTSAAVKSAD